MKENKKERFKRVVDARVNTVANCLRLIGNCSRKTTYDYTKKQVDKIFDTLQAELDKAKARYNGEKDFSIKEKETEYANVVLSLSSTQLLRASVIDDKTFPAIEVELLTDKKNPKRVCFIEKNDQLRDGIIGVGVYHKDCNNPRYFEAFEEKFLDYAEEGKSIKLSWETVASIVGEIVSKILEKEVICTATHDSHDYWTVGFKDYRISVDEICKLLDRFNLSEEDRMASFPEEGKKDATSIDMALTQQLLQQAIGHSWEQSLATEEALYLINLTWIEV